MSAQEESQPWFYESHNHAKKSKWLQSTLSELEDKTIKMLNLIQGNADTFAKRAEMYYRKRPELVDMLEDFYRSYRCLVENYDNLRSSRKYWNFIDKPSASPALTCDSCSEVDDPNEEEEALTKHEDLQDNNNEKGNISRYSFEACQVEEKNPIEKKGTFEMKPIIDRIRRTKYTVIEDNVEIARKTRSMEAKWVYPKEEEAATPYHKNESKEITVSSDSKLHNEPRIAKKIIQVEIPENLSDVRVENPLSDIAKNEKENIAPSLIDNEASVMISEVERLKGENASYKMEMQCKDEEKREVIRQLSTSLDILRRENDSLRNFIRGSRIRGRVFQIGDLKVSFQKNPMQKPVKSSFPLVAL